MKEFIKSLLRAVPNMTTKQAATFLVFSKEFTLVANDVAGTSYAIGAVDRAQYQLYPGTLSPAMAFYHHQPILIMQSTLDAAGPVMQEVWDMVFNTTSMDVVVGSSLVELTSRQRGRSAGLSSASLRGPHPQTLVDMAGASFNRNKSRLGFEITSPSGVKHRICPEPVLATMQQQRQGKWGPGLPITAMLPYTPGQDGARVQVFHTMAGECRSGNCMSHKVFAEAVMELLLPGSPLVVQLQGSIAAVKQSLQDVHFTCTRYTAAAAAGDYALEYLQEELEQGHPPPLLDMTNSPGKTARGMGRGCRAKKAKLMYNI